MAQYVAVALAQRQSHRDHDYSKGDKFDQIIRPFSIGRPITEEASSANPQRVGSFHILPFINEMTILFQ
jgi:hypothetical protein